MQSWQVLAASRLSITLYSSEQAEPFNKYNPHRGIINCATYNHTNKVIASCGQDSKIELRSVSKYQEKLLEIMYHSVNEEPSSVNCCQFSSKSKYIAAGSANGTVKIWDMKAYKEPFRKLKGHVGAITSIAWTNDEEILASASTYGDIFLHKAQTGALVDNLNTRLKQGYNNIKISEGEGFKRLAACTNSGSILVWDLNSPSSRPVYHHEDEQKNQITCISVSAFKPVLLAAASLGSSLTFYDIHDKKVVKTIATEEPLTAVAFHNNGHHILVGGLEGGLWVYDLRKLIEKTSSNLKRHDTQIKSVCFANTVDREHKEVREKERESRNSQARVNSDNLEGADLKAREATRNNINIQNQPQPQKEISEAGRAIKNATYVSSMSKLTGTNKGENNRLPTGSNARTSEQLSHTGTELRAEPEGLPSSQNNTSEVTASTPRLSKPVETSELPPDSKLLLTKLQQMNNETKMQMHERFDAMHLQFIRQMQIQMRVTIQKMQNMYLRNRELEDKIKRLEAEKQNHQKNTY